MPLDPRISQMILEGVDTRVKQYLKTLPYHAYGIVATVDAANLKAGVYVSGDVTASAGFSFPAHSLPAVGDRVRVVIDPRGDRYVEEVIPSSLVASNPMYVEIAEKPVTDAPGTYPLGISHMVLLNVEPNWPVSFGVVETHRSSIATTRTYQVLTGTTGNRWIRSAHTTAPDGVWNSWQRMDRKLRFIPLGSEFVPYNAATEAGAAGGEIDKSLELTGIPANLEGTVMTTGRMLIRHTLAPASSGQYFVARHSTGNITTAVVYAQQPTQWVGINYIVQLGGTNNRTIRLGLNPGTSGTCTYHFTYSGYWTEE